MASLNFVRQLQKTFLYHQCFIRASVPVCLALMLVLVPESRGQLTWDGCDPLTAGDFEVTEVLNRTGDNGALATHDPLSEPINMALDAHYDAQGLITHIDIYFVERLGNVKLLNGATDQVSTIGNIEVWGKADNALMGIALHPDFKNNRWMYLWYAPNELIADKNRISRLSRFTLKGDNTLDMGSELIMMENLMNTRDQWHSGGPMTFDKHGDLWITVGNNSLDHNKEGTGSHISPSDSNTSDEWGASNTASRRGSILRIHPDSSAQGYRMPSGGENFGEYWAAEFEKQGKAALAAEYRDPAKVLPEIYTKGHRSNFSISVHPTKRWLAWGDVNPGGGGDEINLVGHPVFGGYPYFYGNQTRTDGHMDTWGYEQDPESPLNTSQLKTGVEELPPAHVPLYSGSIEGGGSINVSITGPIYVYDSKLKSDVKFPPHMDNTLINISYSSNTMYVSKIDESDLSTSNITRLDDGIFSDVSVRKPIQALYGPDGAFYMLNYGHRQYGQAPNSGIVRVEYTGSCVSTSVEEGIALKDLGVRISGSTVYLEKHQALDLYSLKGSLVFSTRPGESRALDLARVKKDRGLGSGLYLVLVRSGDEKARQPVLLAK